MRPRRCSFVRLKEPVDVDRLRIWQPFPAMLDEVHAILGVRAASWGGRADSERSLWHGASVTGEGEETVSARRPDGTARRLETAWRNGLHRARELDPPGSASQALASGTPSGSRSPKARPAAAPDPAPHRSVARPVPCGPLWVAP